MKYTVLLLMFLLKLATAAPAGAQQISVPADGGSFEFDIKIKVSNAPIVSGTVKNQTSKAWTTARFTVDFFNSRGERMQNPMQKFDPYATSWLLEITGLARGKPTEIGVPGWGTQMSGRLEERFSRFEIKFAGGEYEVDYKISLMKPSLSPSLAFEDDALTFSFQLPPSRRGVDLTLQNKTQNPVRIDWNQVSYVDIEAVAHKVLHQGVRFVQRDQPMPSTTVPPGAKVSDQIYPSDAVVFAEREWVMPPIFPAGPDALSLKGKTFSIFLPLEVNGATKNYNFVFSIDDVQPQ